MLEICLSSLFWSVNICSSIESEKEVLKAIEGNTALGSVYLAQGRPYESDYERDAERERKQRDIWNHGGDRESEADTYRDRNRYDADDYRREAETEIYREPDGHNRGDDERDYYQRGTETYRIYRDRSRQDEDNYRREVETDRIYREPNL